MMRQTTGQTAIASSPPMKSDAVTSVMSPDSSGNGTLARDQDGALHAFSSLLCSAVASPDGIRSVECAATAAKAQEQQRSAALPRLYANEVLEATANQLEESIGQLGRGTDGVDDGIWWLASVPSLDLRNKSRPLSNMLTQRLAMSPAVSAAFNLSLPLRALCADSSVGSDKAATCLTALPRQTVLNVAASYKSLVESRLRSSLSALLKRTLNNAGGSLTIATIGSGARGGPNHSDDGGLRAQTVGLISLMSKSNAVVVTAAVTSFKTVDIPGASTDEGLDETGHLMGRTVPLIFEAVLGVSVHGIKTTAVLRAPGSLTGQFVAKAKPGLPPRLARAEITIDAPHLLREMMTEARKAVRQAVSTSAANIALSSASTSSDDGRAMQATLKGAMGSVQRAMALQEEEDSNDTKKNTSTKKQVSLPRRVSSLSADGTSMDSKRPATSSANKTVLPVPPQGRMRSSLARSGASSGSITDDEESVNSERSHNSSSGSEQTSSSKDSDRVMPPPRPRSPLSKSRSSARLLFYTGRKSASTGDAPDSGGQHVDQGAAAPKSQRQNASWSNRSSSSFSSSNSSAGPSGTNSSSGSSSSASAATSAGFALLRKPNANESQADKKTEEKSEAGVKRKTSNQNMPLRKRRVLSCPSDVA